MQLLQFNGHSDDETLLTTSNQYFSHKTKINQFSKYVISSLAIFPRSVYKEQNYSYSLRASDLEFYAVNE